MGYYNFPHTRNYDQDLGFLIKKYINLIEELKKIEDVEKAILKEINNIVTKMLNDGDIKLDIKYIEETKTLNFVFGTVGPKKERGMRR